MNVKWKSLTSPATLPLTSDYCVRSEMLVHYTYGEHKLMLGPEYSSLEQARSRLLGQMIAFRLAKGFQAVKGPQSPEGFALFEDATLGEENRSFYLMKGNIVHRIVGTDDTITVGKYHPDEAFEEKKPPPKIYQPLVKSTLEPTYERVNIPLSLARDEYNWSEIDSYIGGHLETFSPRTGFWRARFSLVPVEPTKATRKPGDTDDELRVEGILRLGQIWQKARITDDEDEPNPGQAGNPLRIDFQTRDLSAVLSTGLLDSQILPGHGIVRPTESSFKDSQRRFAETDLKRLAEDLQGPGGIAIKDRRWYLRLHRSAFVGLDLTSWLVRTFEDIKSREEAEQQGDKLMESGLFKHVRSAHGFRDANIFYTFAPEYQIAKANAPVKSNSPSPRVVSADKPSHGPQNKTESPLSKAVTSPSTLAPASATGEQKKRPRVELTGKMQCDIDTRKRSDRKEAVSLHYDRICNPEACYHFRLEWMSTTEKLIEEAITSWATTLERWGWKLVQAPISEACKIAEVNPFRTPTIVKFAVAPPEQEPDLSHVDSAAPETLPTHRYHPYQRALLKRFDFVMDVEAAVNMPDDIDLRYSYDNEQYSFSQYIHKTGTLMAQVDLDGRLLLVANRLANNRSSFAREAAARVEKREQERAVSDNMSSRPGTSALTLAQPHGSPHGSPQIWPSPHLSERGTASQVVTQTLQTAESVKESLQAFCANSEALLAFYAEVIRKDPLLSPHATPSMKPRRALSTRSTPMLQATIPSLELPPIFSGIGQLLSGPPASTSGLPGTPLEEIDENKKDKT